MKVFQNGSIENESHVVRAISGGMQVVKLPNNETRAALLGNIFLSEGKAGKVLKVTARNRTGGENFISSMRKGLTENYSEGTVVGLGGVFVMKEGKAYVHVMDDFSVTPIHTDYDLNSWLTWHEISAPIIALGDFVSQETDFQLRLQHFHCYSNHNHGGHYHFDTTPTIVEYEGYFNVAERIILIDKSEAKSFTLATVPKLATILLSVLIARARVQF